MRLRKLIHFGHVAFEVTVDTQVDVYNALMDLRVWNPKDRFELEVWIEGL